VAYGIVLVFEGVSEADYWAVNDRLGIARDDWTVGWPEGMQSHAGGATATGWIVTEIWNSKADQERFMATRLGAALAAQGLPEPVQVIESEIVSVQQLGK
jgi:hypothetical protein